MARALNQHHVLRASRDEAAAQHTHASNLLYLKRRRHRAVSPAPVPGEDGTPQTISERLFYLLVGVIGAGAAAAWLYVYLRASLVLP
jgi:hypothetical protein